MVSLGSFRFLTKKFLIYHGQLRILRFATGKPIFADIMCFLNNRPVLDVFVCSSLMAEI